MRLKDAEIAELKQSVQRLLEQFRLAQQKRFGMSSERHDYQGELFNEAEVTIDEPAGLITHDDVSALPKDCCGYQLVLMGQDSSEKLQFIPAQIKVIEHIRLKYSCNQCETQGTQANIKQAPVP
ncbi:IS66 family transposase zinc-finger binding domain-containing protein, partial [Shewanella surugensis]